LTEHTGSDEWVLDMDLLRKLEPLATDANFQNKWRAIKNHNKKRLAEWVKKHCHIEIDVESLFDIQVKRIHEYKRQFMNILYAIHRYLTIKSMSPEERKNVQPRTIMFGGKSAPGYINAKKIIKLVN
jgi:starch phosphorylase